MNGAINLIRELENKHDANKLNLAQNTLNINKNDQNIAENEEILLNLVNLLVENGTITNEQALEMGVELDGN